MRYDILALRYLSQIPPSKRVSCSLVLTFSTAKCIWCRTEHGSSCCAHSSLIIYLVRFQILRNHNSTTTNVRALGSIQSSAVPVSCCLVHCEIHMHSALAHMQFTCIFRQNSRLSRGALRALRVVATVCSFSQHSFTAITRDWSRINRRGIGVLLLR